MKGWQLFLALRDAGVTAPRASRGGTESLTREGGRYEARPLLARAFAASGALAVTSGPRAAQARRAQRLAPPPRRDRRTSTVEAALRRGRGRDRLQGRVDADQRARHHERHHAPRPSRPRRRRTTATCCAPSPGLNVIQMSARDINITSRQGTVDPANSQLALLDGRSIYLDFFGLILWDFVPVEPERHQADRGRARPRLGGLGRQRAHRRREHHHQVAARGARATSVTLTRRALRPRRGLARGRGRGQPLRRAASASRGRPNDTLVVPPRRRATSTPTRFAAARSGTIPLRASARSAGSSLGGAPIRRTATGPGDVREPGHQPAEVRPAARPGADAAAAASPTAAATRAPRASSTPASAPSTSQSGSYLGYGRVGYTQGRASSVGGLREPRSTPRRRTCCPATRHGQPVAAQLQDPDLRPRGRPHRPCVGGNHILSYGGNVRRNNFDITLAPERRGPHRVRAPTSRTSSSSTSSASSVGGRVDKFGNIDDPVFSPRVTAMFKPRPTTRSASRSTARSARRRSSTTSSTRTSSRPRRVDLRAARALCCPPLRPLVPREPSCPAAS